MKTNRVSAQQIKEIVAENMGLDSITILSGKRNRSYVDARKMLAHFLEKYTTMTASDVGKMTSGRGRGSVYYYRKTFEDFVSFNPKMKGIYSNIEYDIALATALHPNEARKLVEIPLFSANDFVSLVMDRINFDEKGTTRENLYVLFEQEFKLNK